MQSVTSPLPGEDFTGFRQRLTMQDPQFQAAARATIPTLGAALGFVPGIGPLAQAGIGAGATYLNQLAGNEPRSNMEILKSGAIPLAAAGAVTALKGAGRGLGAIVRPGAMREAGVEAAAQRVGAEVSSVDRIFSTPASKAAYDALQAQGPLTTDPINQVVSSAVNKLSSRANPPRAAVAYLQNLGKKYAPGGQADYADVVDELQSLRGTAEKAFAKDDNVTGRALMDARAGILDQLDKVSPAAKEANAIYRREQAQQNILQTLRAPNPGVKIRNLFEQDKLAAGAFNQNEIKDIIDIADKITAVGSATPYGEAHRLVSAFAEPLSGMLTNRVGRWAMRNMMGPNGQFTPAGIATAVQYWRGYSAQQR
jgi:hypothetical protein